MRARSGRAQWDSPSAISSQPATIPVVVQTRS